MVTNYRLRSIRTKPVSIRIDSDLLDYMRSQSLNLSSTVNSLLRGYLYIQSVDKEVVFGRLNARVPVSPIKVDVYFSDYD